MTTYGNMTAKKRAFNKAFAATKQPAAGSSSSAAPSASASASLYDFDFDDVDASASIVARKSLVKSASLASSKKPTTSAQSSSKLQRSASASTASPALGPSSALSAPKSPKPIKKTRPRSAVLASRPAISSSCTTTTPTAIPPPAPLATQPSPKRSSAAQRKVAPLARSLTTPASTQQMKPPVLHRAAVSDPYDLPMSDAPPIQKPENRRPNSRQAAKTSEERPARQQKATAVPPVTAPPPPKPATKATNVTNSRIDLYFKTTSNVPADRKRENIPAASKATSQIPPNAKPYQAKTHATVSPSQASPSRPRAARPVSRGSVSSNANSRAGPGLGEVPANPHQTKLENADGDVNKQPNPPMKRRRLIDTLVSQMENSSESDAESCDGDRPGVNAGRTAPQNFTQNSANKSDELQQRRSTFQAGPRIRTRGPKVTYSMQRSILADPGENDPNHDPFALPILPSISSPKKARDSFDFDDGPESDDDSGLAKGTIRSVHELRMAGANNRFADQIDDLFDRIGAPSPKPTSMRRNALLELASHIKEKTFSRQFRDNGAEGRLFAKIGQETDTVSGFALVAILLTLLSSYSMPHVLPLLQENKVVHFLEGLLQSTESITELSHQRQANLSRNGKDAVAKLKKDLIKLPVWKGSTSPKDLSPRTMALKFMDLYCKPVDMGNFVVLHKSMSDTLFSILHQHSDHEWRQDASSDEKLDCLLAASVLGAHAMGFQDLGFKAHWNTNHLPVVVAVADMTLADDSFGPFEHAVLRLTLNLSNNNPGAVGATGLLALFKNFAAAVCTTFEHVKDNIGKHDLNSDFSPFTKLVLMLGAMINFCEHCPALRHSVDDWDEENSPIDGMIGIFLQSHMATYQADSVEKTQLNVGFGYLAILLGYLCLSRSVRRKLETRSAGKGLSDLRDTVREFMIMQSKVDDGRGSSGDHMQRLQKLLEELEMGI